MALPVSGSGSGLPPDVAVSGWAAITVQVAWTLKKLQINPRGVLRIARDHVLFHLPPGMRLAAAEDLADHLTRGFVARVRGEPLDPTFKQDFAMPVSERWRSLIEGSSDPVATIVFRYHYGAGISLEQLAQHYGLDLLAVEGGRAGLRATIRRQALADGLPIQRWSPVRLDRQLERLANFSPHDSPPLFEVAEGCHADWIDRCPRCERTINLIRSRCLTPDDLEVPVGTVRPSGHLSVLVLQFAPESLVHRSMLAKEFSARKQVLGEDVLLVEVTNRERVFAALRLAAEVGAPRRDHLRTALLRGPGRWTRVGLIGPLPDRALDQLRRQPWGVIDGEGELPEPLPEPPSARWAWAGVAGLAAVFALAITLLLTAPVPGGEVELSADFTSARGGVWYHFTISDTAQLLVIQELDGEPRIVFQTRSPADKASLARADGTYLGHSEGGRLLLAASAEPFEGLGALVEAASRASDPMGDLAARLKVQRPEAVVQRSWSTGVFARISE
ncbi:MAG: hypothetical protein EA397_18250 [Deltaproteobacteria bacterium]|nr:MAG: hypothetical protein EA397_18250 [Deltaproteobacteria bacterium]